MAHTSDARGTLGDGPSLVSGAPESAFGKHHDDESSGDLAGMATSLARDLGAGQQPNGYKEAHMPFPNERKESYASPSSPISPVPLTLDFDAISTQYQARYLTEQMARLRPLDRKVWYREDLDLPFSPSAIPSIAVYSSASPSASSSSLSSTSPSPVACAIAPNSSRPRRKSEVSINPTHQEVEPTARAQSVGPRPKGVRFADDLVTSSTTSPGNDTMPGFTGGPVYIAKTPWGTLFNGGRPTERLRRFLKDIGRGLARDGVISPEDLYQFYREFPASEKEKRPHLRDVFNRSWESPKYRRLYDGLGIRYENLRDNERGRYEPCISPDSFAQWMILQISAHPNQEAKRLAAIAKSERFKSTVHSQTSEPQLLPSSFPLHLVQSDEVLKVKNKEKLKSLISDIWPKLEGFNPQVIQPSLPGDSSKHRHRERQAPEGRIFIEVPQRQNTIRTHGREAEGYFRDVRGEQHEREDRRAYRAYYGDSIPKNGGYDRRYQRPQTEERIVRSPRIGLQYVVERPPTERSLPRDSRYSSRNDRLREYSTGRRSQVYTYEDRLPEEPLEYFHRPRNTERARLRDYVLYQDDIRRSEDDRASDLQRTSANSLYYHTKPCRRERTWQGYAR